jgi:branched-chain amino acid transport system ATP-binding protein
VPCVSSPTSRRAAALNGLTVEGRAFAVNATSAAAALIATGLAPVVVKRFRDAVMMIKGLGISLLLAESNLTSAAAIADRRYVIDRGEITFQGIPQDALANDADHADAARLRLGAIVSE